MQESSPSWFNLASSLLGAVAGAITAAVTLFFTRQTRKAEAGEYEARTRNIHITSGKTEQDRLEAALEKLWTMQERVDKVCDERDKLRDDKRELTGRVEELERELKYFRDTFKLD